MDYEISKLGIPIERKYFNVGDYTWGDICIERKTVSDFYKSLYEGRLYRQLFNLKDAYPYPKLAIIGTIPPENKWIRIKRKRRIQIPLTAKEKDKKEKLMFNNWAIIERSLKIDVLRFDTNKQFILYLTALFLNTNKDKTKYKPVNKKGESLQEIRSNILCCIPGWGRKTADYISREIPTLHLLLKMTDKQLKKKKLNKKQIKNLNMVINDALHKGN